MLTSMNFNFVQTTNPVDLTNSLSTTAIDLAEATYNYGALKVIFGIFLVVVIGMIILFGYQLLIGQKKTDSIYETCKKIDNYFDTAGDKELGSSEAHILVRRALNHDATLVKYYILRIRAENHIDNIEAVKTKVTRLTENMFGEIQAYLAKFSCHTQELSDIIDYKDCTIIKDMMLEQIYRTKADFTIHSMDQTIDLYFTGIKSIYLKKIPLG